MIPERLSSSVDHLGCQTPRYRSTQEVAVRPLLRSTIEVARRVFLISRTDSQALIQDVSLLQSTIEVARCPVTGSIPQKGIAGASLLRSTI